MIFAKRHASTIFESLLALSLLTSLAIIVMSQMKCMMQRENDLRKEVFLAQKAAQVAYERWNGDQEKRILLD